jgi:aminocarboxymuconate-semialdehyde decarboxylase
MAESWNKYANSRARKRGAPGRTARPKSTTIDVHSHIFIRDAAEFSGPHVKADTLSQFASEETQALQKKQNADRVPVMVETKQRLKDMDKQGIDIQLVMCAPGQCHYGAPLDILVKASQMINDGIAEYISRVPDRFVGLGTVPLTNGEEAAKELERSMKTFGFKGAQILTNVAGEKEISDPSLEPFWKKAEQLGAVILLHPNGFTHAQRFKPYYFTNVIGNPLDTTVALHHLIFSGVLERYPKLKIIAVHGGGFLGAYWGRIDHAWGARSDAKDSLPKAPTTYLKKIYFDTVVFTPGQLKALVDTFGVDHVVLGTDYPYDMAEYDPIEHINSVKGFNGKVRAAIAGGNAAKLLGIA